MRNFVIRSGWRARTGAAGKCGEIGGDMSSLYCRFRATGPIMEWTGIYWAVLLCRQALSRLRHRSRGRCGVPVTLGFGTMRAGARDMDARLRRLPRRRDGVISTLSLRKDRELGYCQPSFGGQSALSSELAW